jgi:site-specific DNA recombinase
MGIRAVAYGRLSRKDGGQSVERQEAHARKVAADHEWDLVTVLQEWVPASLLHKPPSATSKKYRKEWRRLIDGIEAREWDAVIFWMADRSARHVLYGSELVAACKTAGLRMVEIDGYVYDFTDPVDEAKYMGEVAGAQQEIAKMAKRIREAKLALAEAGEANPGGNRPFGFTGSGRNRVPAHRALAEQEYANEAARRVIAGDSLRAICRDWNDAGIRTTTGRQWGTRSLRQMLLSPRLAGYRVHHGRLIETTHWQPVIARDVWEQVRSILTDPARTTRVGGGQPRYELVGLVYCGECGRRLRVKMKRHRGPKRYLCYYCPGYCVARSARWLEQLIETGLFAEAARPGRYADAAKGLEATSPARDVYARLAANQARLDRLGDEELLAQLDDDLTRAGRVARVRARLEGEMARDRDALARLQGNRIMVALPPNLEQIWPDLSLDRRRSILAVLFQGKAILVCHQEQHDGDDAAESVKVVPLSDVPGQR